jgi:mono/diheme cytochrome c family protein
MNLLSYKNNYIFCFSITTFFLIFTYSCDNQQKVVKNENIGKNLFEKNCALCHGNDGKLMAAGAPDLSISKLDKDAALIAIEKGSLQKGMPAYENRFSKEELLKIRDYIFELRKINK